MKRILHFIAFALALVLLVGACSGKQERTAAVNNVGGPSNPVPSKADHATPALPTGKPINIKYSVPKVPAPPVADRKAVCPTQYVPPSDEIPSEEKSWIVAQVDFHRGYGPSCTTFGPGDECWVPLFGGWKLVGAQEGSIVVQVFEDGSTKPAVSPEVGPVPAGGRFSESSKIHYVVGRNVKQVTVRAILKDSLGRVVAKSIPETVKVPTC
ncbi:MAG: hypothetical protein ABR548_08170 [Actinomycetota bacterium]